MNIRKRIKAILIEYKSLFNDPNKSNGQWYKENHIAYKTCTVDELLTMLDENANKTSAVDDVEYLYSKIKYWHRRNPQIKQLEVAKETLEDIIDILYAAGLMTKEDE